MSHTPGPWRYEPSTKTIRAEPSNYWLATMDSWDGAVDHEGNARLIAVAPEMAQILRDLVNWYALDEGPHYMTPARALLARIEGA